MVPSFLRSYYLFFLFVAVFSPASFFPSLELADDCEDNLPPPLSSSLDPADPDPESDSPESDAEFWPFANLTEPLLIFFFPLALLLLLLLCEYESDLADKDDDSVRVLETRPVDSPDLSPSDAVVADVSVDTVSSALAEVFIPERRADSDDDDDAPLEVATPVPDEDAPL